MQNLEVSEVRRCGQNPLVCENHSAQHKYSYHNKKLNYKGEKFERRGIYFVCPTEGCDSLVTTTSGFKTHLDSCFFNVKYDFHPRKRKRYNVI